MPRLHLPFCLLRQRVIILDELRLDDLARVRQASPPSCCATSAAGKTWRGGAIRWRCVESSQEVGIARALTHPADAALVSGGRRSLRRLDVRRPPTAEVGLQDRTSACTRRPVR